MSYKVWALILLGTAAVAVAVGLIVAPESVESIGAKWERSTHSDEESEAFTHWRNQGLAEVPGRCASCHSTLGFRDFLGVDGTEAGTVDEPVERGTVVFCGACHNPAAHQLTTVGFPSDIEITGLDSSAVCMTCHQGIRAGQDVKEATEGIDPDATSPDLVFINVHYYIAAATWLGSEVEVGYQYPDRSYVRRFEHVPDMQTCAECHDPHSQTVDPDKCSPCHVNVAGFADLASIRTSEPDYDGDGDASEGLQGEIETMRRRLYEAMQAYASQEATALVYADESPFFFVDSNGNGEADENETTVGNGYRTWTPRLLRTAYNYHFSLQDPGNYSHNGHYVMQLLYDSLDDLGERISVDLEPAVRPGTE